MSGARPDTWMPLFIGAYLRKTTRLTTLQHGCYFLLLIDYWVNGPPPDDDEQLAAIVRQPLKDWQRLRPALTSFFDIADGQWRNERADEELAKAEQLSNRGRAAGLASVQQRANKTATRCQQDDQHDDQQDGNETANKTPTSEQLNVNPLPSPSPKKKERDARSRIAPR